MLVFRGVINCDLAGFHQKNPLNHLMGHPCHFLQKSPDPNAPSTFHSTSTSPASRRGCFLKSAKLHQTAWTGRHIPAQNGGGGGSVEGDMGDRHLLSVGRLFCLSLGLRWSSLNVSIVICAVILFVFEGLIFSQNQWKVHQYSNYKRSLNRDYSFAVIFVEGDTCNK